jgi:hypothetical protein
MPAVSYCLLACLGICRRHPPLEIAASTKQGFRTTGNFAKCTPGRDLHTAFNLPYVYDYITELCRQQAEVMQNHENDYVRGIGQGEARYRKCKWLELGGGQTTTV